MARPYINLTSKARGLVLQDIWKQDPKAGVRDEDLVVLIFEKDLDRGLWMAMVEVKKEGVKDRFFEVTYFLENDLAHVTSYRAQATNPYTL